MWGLDCAQLMLEQFEKEVPKEHRPRVCLECCTAWDRGKIKMPLAKKTILDAHAVAKEINDSEHRALSHAIESPSMWKLTR